MEEPVAIELSVFNNSVTTLVTHLTSFYPEEAEQGIEAFLEMMRMEPNEELGELAALKHIVQTPNRIRCATLAWDALKHGLAEQNR